MCKRLFSFLILTILFMFLCDRSWGATATCTAFSETEGSPPSCPITFNSGTTVGVYNFPDGSSLRVEFVGGVKTSFSLTVTEFTLTDGQLAARLDPKVFPPDTTSCFHYGGGCEEYAFTGNAGGPNGVPVKNVDYGPPIKLTLTYFSTDTVNDPAFAHAPGESTTFSEDILDNYSTKVVSTDDTMDGSTPSLSSVIALNKKLEENDQYCWVSPSSGQTFKVGDEVTVAFQLFASGPCIGNTGTSIRDHFARLALFSTSTGFQPVRSDEGGKDFQFDNHDKMNEREFSTAGLAPGEYFITVRSTKFPPQTRRIVLGP